MEGRPLRRLVVTVRAAADLGETPSNPYVVVQLGDQEIETDVATAGGENPVWDEPIELRLPPPLPDEKPLQLRVKIMSHIRLFPDRLIAGGTLALTDLYYGGGQHEIKVPLWGDEGKRTGNLHMGLLMEKEAQPGEVVESAAGTVLGEVFGGGPATPAAAAVPGAVLPSAEAAEMKAGGGVG
ncbi:Elicitor-responsive [Chlorella sorokiniana]|uniref:Elicitor-responsive n=1 Tax=Chlorella sorokiniana TaxID=3076 RepID=A0A2P6U030_CHLSO|nr:Elicitor-responsive [Chlorella sorokiniana]|eukprot:PRW59675.1 Elicitor-responsive [Chlorella sorokiniana]